AEVFDLGIANDSASAVAQRLRTMTGIDVLITSGGIAGSECDVTAKGFEAIGGEVSTLRLNLKPGRSIAFGRLGQLRSLHLPGNPIAALVSARLFAVPMLSLLMGSRSPDRTDVVTAGEILRHREGRTEFVLAKITDRSAEGRPIAVRAGKSSSANLQPLCEADGFVEIPAETGDVPQGQALRFHPFGCEFG
ncbi:MAG: molybdopterin-binding protein, partial [Devosia sp.]